MAGGRNRADMERYGCMKERFPRNGGLSTWRAAVRLKPPQRKS